MSHLESLRDRANHTGTQTAATISDFDASVGSAIPADVVRSDGSVGFTEVVNGVTPSDTANLATKGYVDDTVAEVTYVPSSLTLNTGNLVSGNVASVQTLSDSNSYIVNEVSGVPGWDIDFNFTSVVFFDRLRLHVLYEGSAAHVVEIQLYNYNTTSFDTLTTFTMTNSMQFIELPISDSTNYIDGTGHSKIKLYHITTGDNSHQIQVDYVSLVKAGLGSAFNPAGYLSKSSADTFYYPVDVDGNPLNGFVKYNSDSTLSWDEVTRTVSIAPTGASYSFYSAGKKFTKTGTDTVQFTDAWGLHIAYFDDSGVLQHTVTFNPEDLIMKYAIVCLGYWDYINKKLVPDLQDERHGMSWPSQLHKEMHLSVGVRYQGPGLDMGLNASGDGSANSHARFSASAGAIQDEDLVHTIPEKLIDDNVAVLYHDGAAGYWMGDATSPNVVRNDPVTGLAYYNQWTGTEWVRTAMTDGYYQVITKFCHPGINYRWLVFMGTTEYATLAEAQAACDIRPNLGALPAPEYLLAFTDIIQTSSTFTNASKTRFVQTTNGDYVDWRTISGFGTPALGTGVSSVNNLIGDVTLNTSNIPDTTDKRYVTDAELSALGSIPVKATGAEVNTGTNDTKFATPKAIADSNVAFLSDIPATPTDATITTTDVTTNNASTAKHGWFPKLPTATGKYLKDDLTWGTPTATATPAGNSGEIQYNDGAGAFAGAANVEIESGNLRLISTTDPSAPSGALILYSKSIAGRHLPKIIGPSGIDTVLQVGLHGNAVMMIAPASGTTAPTIWGGTLTTAATMSAQQTIASSSPWLATWRKRFQTSTTAGNLSGMRTAYVQYFRGNAAGFGGFFFRAQLGHNINLNGSQLFVGLCASTAALGTGAGAVAALVNMIGMGYDTTDASSGNWFFYRNDGSGTATKVDLGATNAARSNVSHGYDLIMYCPPGAATDIYVRIVNLHNGATVLDTSYNTDIPAVNTGMAFKAEVNNGAVAAAANLEVAKVYIETDY